MIWINYQLGTWLITINKPVAAPLEQKSNMIKTFLLAEHSIMPSVDAANIKPKMASVFFLPIQSIRKNAKIVPGNSAKVVQINST